MYARANELKGEAILCMVDESKHERGEGSIGGKPEDLQSDVMLRIMSVIDLVLWAIRVCPRSPILSYSRSFRSFDQLLILARQAYSPFVSRCLPYF